MQQHGQSRSALNEETKFMNQPDYTSHIIAHKACSPQMHPSANALVIMLRPLLHTPFT
jgi:hypothetical protein